MSYDFYLDKILLPVTPSKLEIKVKNQNKTVVLIDEGEINTLKKAGLLEISFTALLPQMQYPFAKYKSEFQSADIFISEIKALKDNRLPFYFKIVRTLPNGNLLFVNGDFGSEFKVSLEEYEIIEDANNGFDLNIKILLKQYKDYTTKTYEFVEPEVVAPVQEVKTSEPTTTTKYTAFATTMSTTAKMIVQEARPAENAPTAKTHTVVKGDCLWAIAKKYLNNGSRYEDIYKLNQALIDGRNKGTGYSKYTIYPSQVLTLPDK